MAQSGADPSFSEPGRTKHGPRSESQTTQLLVSLWPPCRCRRIDLGKRMTNAFMWTRGTNLAPVVDETIGEMEPFTFG